MFICFISGNTATDTYYDNRAEFMTDSGDYYCFAKVGENEDEQKSSGRIPIQVIKSEYYRLTVFYSYSA